MNGFKAIDTSAKPLCSSRRNTISNTRISSCRPSNSIHRIHLILRYTSIIVLISGQDQSKRLSCDPSDSISKQVQASCKSFYATFTSPTSTVTSSIDLYMASEAWHALMELQDEGSVRLIGVSNTYDVRILQILRKSRWCRIASTVRTRKWSLGSCTTGT